ncbi:NAD(P)/FAD-dependent oxidoreductase [Nocardioides marmoriginsengisoli]|nr:FAD-dependent oxidoreductase [Nocardioides marmoriginsengisoli]
MSQNSVGTVIIGGGIGGVALAYYLAELGEADILVVEGRELASGCTGGSLGGVRQQFSTPYEVELALRGRTFWQTFEQTFDYSCTYYQDGYLMLTGREEIFENLGRAADVQRAGGAPNVEMVAAADLTDIVPWLSTQGLVGGCWTPEDGRVNPTDGVYGLAAAARKLGVRFLQHTRVEKIEKSKGGWTLQTPEPVTARRVIVAGGLGSPDLMRPFGLDLPITPMMVHYGFTTPVISDQRLPMTIDLDTGFCVEREQDAAVVTILDSSLPDTYGVEDMLLEFAEAAAVRAPVFTEVGIRSTISAAADATGGDGHPFIGEFEPGLWTMTGFDGHGTMQGPAIAKFTANLIAGIADPFLDPAVFDPRREATATQEWLRAARR